MIANRKTERENRKRKRKEKIEKIKEAGTDSIRHYR